MSRSFKGVKYDKHGNVENCLFCNIHKGTEPAAIVREDENFVVFKTTSPMTVKHLLVTPRVHVKNAGVLSGRKDADLVREMVKIGELALGDLSPGAQFCFHMPPFNSIDHLHLHAIARPESMSWLGHLKYSKYLPNCWTADQVIRSCLQSEDKAKD